MVWGENQRNEIPNALVVMLAIIVSLHIMKLMVPTIWTMKDKVKVSFKGPSLEMNPIGPSL